MTGAPEIRWPGDTDRLAIIGSTGSGKTRAAAWHLSRRNYDRKPWVIFDFKGDDFLERIRWAREIGIEEKIPSKPGLYIVRPFPGEGAEVDAFLWRIWERGDVGVYIDEGYMIGDGRGDSKAYRAILTQGRSKHIPVITLSQRPVFMSRFVFTEAQFFQIFQMNDAQDIKTVSGMVPLRGIPLRRDYNSLWFDVVSNRLTRLAPVPDDDAILATFRRRLAPPRRVI